MFYVFQAYAGVSSDTSSKSTSIENLTQSTSSHSPTSVFKSTADLTPETKTVKENRNILCEKSVDRDDSDVISTKTHCESSKQVIQDKFQPDSSTGSTESTLSEQFLKENSTGESFDETLSKPCGNVKAERKTMSLDLTNNLRRRQNADLIHIPSSPTKQTMYAHQSSGSTPCFTSSTRHSFPYKGINAPFYAQVRHFAQSPVIQFRHLPIAVNPYMSPYLATDEQLRMLCPVYMVVSEIYLCCLSFMMLIKINTLINISAIINCKIEN